MRKIALSIAIAGAAVATPAFATINMVSPSTDNPGNVLCNQGGVVGTSVDCYLGTTAITFTTTGGTTELHADGGQAEVEGPFNLATNNPNDTLNLTNIVFFGALGETFSYAEFNLFQGSGTVSFDILDNLGNLFTFGGTLGNGANRFAFEGVDGQSIAQVTASVTNGGFQSLKQVRLGEAIISAVPEPSTWAMMILGLGLTGAALRRRQQVTVRYA